MFCLSEEELSKCCILVQMFSIQRFSYIAIKHLNWHLGYCNLIKKQEHGLIWYEYRSVELHYEVNEFNETEMIAVKSSDNVGFLGFLS